MNDRFQNRGRGQRVRPSVRTDKYQVKNVVTPDTQKAKQRQEQRARQTRDARVISSSLRHKSEKDFKLNRGVPTLGSNAKRIIVIIAIILAVVVLGVCAGIFAFVASTSAKLSIGEAAKSELVSVQENHDFYSVFAVDIDETPDDVADILMLTRIDPSDKQFIIINIPVETYVASASGGATTFKKIAEQKNDEELISAISSFSELGIAHYIKANAEGISSLIDGLGGIEVNLPEYIDDPSVSDTYIPQGVSTINGGQTMSLLRSKNFSGGTEVISQNQRQVAIGILSGVLFSPNLNVAFLVDKLAGNFKTDMSVAECINFVDTYKTTDKQNILNTEVPGYKTMRNNVMVYMVDASAWKNMRTQISYGTLPESEKETTIEDINPSSFKIEIQNGAGIDGAGAMLADKLRSLGYDVTGSINADTNIYQDTLIIYSGDNMKSNAQAVKNSINNGRLVNGNGLYNMTTDILIIIGADLKI